MAIDPICQMEVNEATALSAERDGATFYFCSEHCQQKFITNGARHSRSQHDVTAAAEPPPSRRFYLHLPDAPGDRTGSSG